jgi:hypothetical protein
MDFGEVLSKAWKIIWKYKILWVFGILAGLGSGASSNGSNGYRNTYQSSDYPQVQRFFENIPPWVWLLVALFIILVMIIFFVLSTIGKIGLIKGTLQADEETGGLSFGKLFSESLRYFWRIFGLTLLIGVATFIIVLVFVVLFIVFTAFTLGIALICLIPLACLLIPISWLLTLFIEQSIIAIVLEDAGIFDGLRRGWNVVTKNIGVMILMGLIIFIGGGILNFLIALPLFLIAMPVILNLIVTNGQSFGTGLIVTLVLFIVYLPVLLVLTGILKAYISAAWTLTYRRLTGKRPAMPAIIQVTPLEPAPPAEPTPPAETPPAAPPPPVE